MQALAMSKLNGSPAWLGPFLQPACNVGRGQQKPHGFVCHGTLTMCSSHSDSPGVTLPAFTVHRPAWLGRRDWVTLLRQPRDSLLSLQSSASAALQPPPGHSPLPRPLTLRASRHETAATPRADCVPMTP